MRSPSIRALGICIAVAACAPARSAAPAPASVPAASLADSLPNDVRWVRASTEYRALALQTYATAAARLPELARGLAIGSWGVILDADETVLDNSEYQRRLAVSHAPFSAKSWTDWVNERAAPAVPGSVEFTRLVHSMHGRVVIVTNRSMAECDATRANLQKAGVDADAVLCQPPSEKDKNPRFDRVQNGSAAPGLPALMVVAWVGDNILDFPSLTQAARSDSTALAQFGRRLFILPNPMYGSWEHLH